MELDHFIGANSLLFIHFKELTEGQRFELMSDIAFGKKCQYSEVRLNDVC